MASSNPILHVGLGGKIRVVRSDFITHSADMIVNPADADMSDDWNTVTKRLYRAAGPPLLSRISDKYKGKPLEMPPPHLSDIHTVNSPSGSFFRAVRYTPSFQMSNCDWIVHTRAPLYRRPRSLSEQRVCGLNITDIETRNGVKYSSILLALKVAHRVALRKRNRVFTVAIPQLQHDGGYFTPRDDAILTLSAIVDYFNHPEWGIRRLNAIARVDITIDPTPMGQVYCQAYNFAWYSMSMHIPCRNVQRSPGATIGLLQRPYPADRPRLPALDPCQSYPSDSAVPTLIRSDTQSLHEISTKPRFNEALEYDFKEDGKSDDESEPEDDSVEYTDELATEYESEGRSGLEIEWEWEAEDEQEEDLQNGQGDHLMDDSTSDDQLEPQHGQLEMVHSDAALVQHNQRGSSQSDPINKRPEAGTSQGGPPYSQDSSPGSYISSHAGGILYTTASRFEAPIESLEMDSSISHLSPSNSPPALPNTWDSRKPARSPEVVRSFTTGALLESAVPAIERGPPTIFVPEMSPTTPPFINESCVPQPESSSPSPTISQAQPPLFSPTPTLTISSALTVLIGHAIPPIEARYNSEVLPTEGQSAPTSAVASSCHSETHLIAPDKLPAETTNPSVSADSLSVGVRGLAREIEALNTGFDGPYWLLRKRKRTQP
ncbi:uncharacterized protein BP5553_06538 [Venustampulla echinocandica]|uniref:Uncharacterized protein n=1 Tax=Venustampulla echinocandica TaxID=2656787 RepID=A0A370TK74_9HELO|nr:uncharacterized protein BP5553_06538 [Venustampulla echinocandica]RDL35926.1 hypothetical protein BP5553_06538 [Venustampulla echinocandica]